MNNRYRIVLVEDEENIITLLSAILEPEGYQVLTARTCEEGRLMYASYHPDLLILDLGLPDRDGKELIELIRRNFQTPVIVLSARSDESEKIACLDAGANDYVTKPFGTGELLARIRSALRLSRMRTGSALNTETFLLGDLKIDYDARTVFLSGREVRFTQTEFNILSFLSRNTGKVMTYAAISKEVWGSADTGSAKRLQVNMANIRKKLGEKPGENRYIYNELGVGYRIRSGNTR